MPFWDGESSLALLVFMTVGQVMLDCYFPSLESTPPSVWGGGVCYLFIELSIYLYSSIYLLVLRLALQLWWMTSLSHMAERSALHPLPYFSLSDFHCFMITSPVCLRLKASRQILICFANLPSLSWLLYLLFSVLALC